ncbi:MAG: beta-propeller fold lactonase family protein [Propionibacteriaceae bacterium]|nr:beta-propeller fold lactonase family protein [Propionibacteriaceae bacterium]
MESSFFVASERDGAVEVVALGFDGSTVAARVPHSSANGLAAHPSLPIVYVATYADGGGVTSVDLRNGSTSEVTGVGEVPCFLLLSDDEGGDADPTLLLSVNYGDGSVSAINLRDGHVVSIRSRVTFPFTQRLVSNPARQSASHPHWIGRNGGDLLVTDLGNDVIHEVALHAGKLVRRGVHRRMPAGSGPRHMCRDATGGLWASHELSNGVSRLGPDAIAVSSSSNRWISDELPANHVGDITHEPEADVVVTANRELNTLGIFTRARAGIEPVAEVDCGGTWPTQFAQRDGVLAVANRDSGNVAMFDVGPSWWENEPELHEVPRPVAIVAAPVWADQL